MQNWPGRAVRAVRNEGYAIVPVAIDQAVLKTLEDTFDAAIAQISEEAELHREVQQLIAGWTVPGSAVNARVWIGSEHAAKGKAMVQGFSPFCGQAAHELAGTAIADLFEQLDEIDHIARMTLDRVTPAGARLPTTIRMLRYDAGDNPGVLVHEDESVFSLVINEDDGRFRIAPNRQGEPWRSQKLTTPTRATTDAGYTPAILFPGKKIRIVDPNLWPSSHEVLPASGLSHRHSLTVFQQTPGINLAA